MPTKRRMPCEIGPALSALIKTRGRSVASVADEIGMTRQGLNQGLRGANELRIETVRKVLAVLGMQWGDLDAAEKTKKKSESGA